MEIHRESLNAKGLSRVASDRTPGRMERVKTRETIAGVTAMESFPWRPTVVSTEADWALRGGLATLKKTGSRMVGLTRKGRGGRFREDVVSFEVRVDMVLRRNALFRGMREGRGGAEGGGCQGGRSDGAGSDDVQSEI